MGICRQLLSTLVIPKDEFRASRRQEEKFVPAEVVPLSTRRGKRETYVREIKGTLTGEVIAYEQKGDNWIIDDKAQQREYEAMKRLHEPVKVPPNILVTAFGVVEL